MLLDREWSNGAEQKAFLGPVQEKEFAPKILELLQVCTCLSWPKSSLESSAPTHTISVSQYNHNDFHCSKRHCKCI